MSVVVLKKPVVAEKPLTLADCPAAPTHSLSSPSVPALAEAVVNAAPLTDKPVTVVTLKPIPSAPPLEELDSEVVETAAQVLSPVTQYVPVPDTAVPQMVEEDHKETTREYTRLYPVLPSAEEREAAAALTTLVEAEDSKESLQEKNAQDHLGSLVSSLETLYSQGSSLRAANDVSAVLVNAEQTMGLFELNPMALVLSPSFHKVNNLCKQFMEKDYNKYYRSGFSGFFASTFNAKNVSAMFSNTGVAINKVHDIFLKLKNFAHQMEKGSNPVDLGLANLNKMFTQSPGKNREVLLNVQQLIDHLMEHDFSDKQSKMIYSNLNLAGLILRIKKQLQGVQENLGKSQLADLNTIMSLEKEIEALKEFLAKSSALLEKAKKNVEQGTLSTIEKFEFLKRVKNSCDSVYSNDVTITYDEFVVLESLFSNIDLGSVVRNYFDDILSQLQPILFRKKHGYNGHFHYYIYDLQVTKIKDSNDPTCENLEKRLSNLGNKFVNLLCETL